MSFNRENVTWQSSSGTWNRTFYEFWEENQDCDNFDPEWDVTYGENFNWVSWVTPPRKMQTSRGTALTQVVMAA